MAETVKNNTRKRRPPIHFDQGYNEDNFQPKNANSYTTRERNGQGTEPNSMNTYAKLLTKFVNSANKKNLQARMKKKQQEIVSSQKKPVMTQQKNASRSEKAPKQERSGTSAKGKQSAQLGQVQNRQEPARTHERGVKKITNSITPSPIAQTKFNKTQAQSHQSMMKNFMPTGNPLNIQSMAKVNQEQILKLISKGTVDPMLFKNQLSNSNDVQSLRNLGKMSQSILRQTIRANQFRQDTKIFRRASYHIGIAYNIYIANVKKKNPNFTPEDLDPTSVSRRMKQQNLQQARLQNLQRQRIKAQQQMMKQRQLIQANAAKQRKGFQQFRETSRPQLSNNIKNTPQKQPICIDLQDEQQPQNPVEVQKTVNVQKQPLPGQKSTEQMIKIQQEKQQKDQQIKLQVLPSQLKQQYMEPINNELNKNLLQNKQLHLHQLHNKQQNNHMIQQLLHEPQAQQVQQPQVQSQMEQQKKQPQYYGEVRTENIQNAPKKQQKQKQE